VPVPAAKRLRASGPVEGARRLRFSAYCGPRSHADACKRVARHAQKRTVYPMMHFGSKKKRPSFRRLLVAGGQF